MRALSEKRLSDYMAQQIADEILSGQRGITGIRGTGIDCPSGNEKNLRSRIIGRTDSDYL